MITGFAPIAAADARVLVLGTVPSRRSLEEQRYYAHARNAFWPIMQALFAGGVELEYSSRQQLLVDARVAVWDVLQSAERSGSLDSGIAPHSAVANDIAGFLTDHLEVDWVFFNGATAEALYKRHVAQTIPPHRRLHLRRLPSTSPANAGIPPDVRLDAWRAIACAVADPPSSGSNRRADLSYQSAAVFVRDIGVATKFYTEVLGLAVELDFGTNVILRGGPTLWQIDPRHVITERLGVGSLNDRSVNRFELYFETDDIEAACRDVTASGAELLHSLHEEPWGQRTVRLFDPDRHLIEIGESMATFVRRLHAQGLTPEQVSAKTSVSMEKVGELIGLGLSANDRADTR
jgi:double-stranded uracil-DNA glycosylase